MEQVQLIELTINIYKNSKIWDKVVLTVKMELKQFIHSLQKEYTFDTFHSVIEKCWGHYKSNFTYSLNHLLVVLLSIDRHMDDQDVIFLEVI